MFNAIVNALIIMLLSLFFWLTKSKLGIIYVAIILLLVLIFLFRFHNIKNNKRLYFEFISIIAFNMPYVLYEYNIINLSFRKMVLCTAIIILFNIIIDTLVNKYVLNNNIKFKLFRERKEDLKRIKEYLAKFNLIGVNGEWGSGKTYLIECLQNEKEMQDKYEFINIYLLSCNLDNLPQILINELEKVLVKYGIYSRYSNSLRKILASNNFINSMFSSIFLDSNSFTASINGFKNEIKKLNKTIVIVFEDLDRINDANVIKKIFSISENLIGKNIKVVYQYDQRNLENIDECFNRNYLYKYIPYTINLTKISFYDIINKVLKEYQNEYNYLKDNDFNFLYIPVRLDWILREIFNRNIEYKLNISNYSVRKVKHFLDEIENTFENEEIYRGNDLKRAVIIFYLIKHFDNDIYNKFTLFKGLIETFLLEFDDNKYTINEIMYKFKNNELNNEDIDTILTFDLNKKALGYLFMIEYRFNSEKKRGIEILEETELQLKDNNYNDKINRVFWHLLCKGKSEYTDMEQMVKVLKRDVLSLPDDKIVDGFNNFTNKMYNEEYKNETGNIVAFYIGIPEFYTLFQAMSIATNKESDWIKFLNFYFSYKKIDSITLDLIRCLEYCNIITKNIYLLIINKFNKLDILQNFNNYESYWRFLRKYLEKLSILGYVNTHNVRSIINFKDKYTYKNIEELKIVLFNPLIKELEKLKNEMPIEKPKYEIDMYIKFIKKNIDIISKNEGFKEESAIKIDMKPHSRFVNQEEYDRLNNLKCTEEELLTEIEKSYIENKISAYEISQLDFIKNKLKAKDSNQ